jgi:hypothetical protein
MTPSTLDKNIQEWVTLDNEHKALNNRLKLVRERKHQLEEQLFQHEQFASLNQNSLKDISIRISDGILKFTKTKITAPLTFTYIKQTLGEIIKNKEQMETVLSYLKSKRETKLVPEIKRFIQIQKE